MTHDENKFLDLLQEYKSDESKKARRNLSVISFAIISMSILGIELKEVKFIGIDLSRSEAAPILVLAILLLVYWAAMFAICISHDKEIQAERKLFLERNVESIKKRIAEIQERKAHKPDWSPSDEHHVKAAHDAYEKQQDRTRNAAKYGLIVNRLETHIPVGLFGFAIFLLIQKLYIAL